MTAANDRTHPLERSLASDPPGPSASARPAVASVTVGPLDVLRLLHSAGGALLTQAQLHAHLARIEWTQEKRRLSQLLVAGALVFACVLCLLLFLGAVTVALGWDTAYRLPIVVAVAALYVLLFLFAWRRLQRLSALGADAFAVTRTELAADLALLRSRL